MHRTLLLVVLSAISQARTLLSPSNFDGKKTALIVDAGGPTRTTDDGVRVLSMIMDFTKGGWGVDVLSDNTDTGAFLHQWNSSIKSKYLDRINFWNVKEFAAGRVDVSDYQRILLGGKLDVLLKHETAVGAYMEKMLPQQDALRERTDVFWDEVPFERCLVRPEADKLCPQVPAFVSKLAGMAHKFIMLSKEDSQRFSDYMVKEDISTDSLEQTIWPLSLKNMNESIPEHGLASYGAEKQKSYVVMMGDMDAVNKDRVSALFEDLGDGSTIMSMICRAIKSTSSTIQIMFMGGLAGFAEKLITDSTPCAIADGRTISDYELQHLINPYKKAVLNPYFKDVNSGISVNNYKSIMSGVPFVSSSFGMHGLSDEIDACAFFPMPKDPSNKTEFAEFFITNIVYQDRYLRFAKKIQKASEACMAAQRGNYRIRDLVSGYA